MENELTELPIPKPIGDFILENAKGVQLFDGRYYHYSEVCGLLKKYAEAYHAAKSEQTGEPCFTKEEVNGLIQDYGAGEYGAKAIHKYLNTRAAAYRMDGMKKALDKAADNATVSYDPRLSSPYFVNKTSITNPINLEI